MAQTETQVVTARLKRPIVEQLDALAEQRRRKTGQLIRRGDLLREAVDQLLADPGKGSGDDDQEFGEFVFEVLAGLEQYAKRSGIEDAQDMAITLGVKAGNDPRAEQVRRFVSLLHGCLQSERPM